MERGYFTAIQRDRIGALDPEVLMDYGRLQRFVMRHGNVAVFDAQGGTHRVHDATPDSRKLVENAEEFLWDGLTRSRAEMEDLVAQSERGLVPGCAECDRLEKELVAARDRDRRENNLEMGHESQALERFKEHRRTHGSNLMAKYG